MCNFARERARINEILTHTINMRLNCRPTNLDELTKLCCAALQLFYHGSCPEECMEAKAQNFVLWHLAHLAHLDPVKWTAASVLTDERATAAQAERLMLALEAD